MGKLNIAHHKSYHPYRADNIARVRQDEARAKAEAELDNDRALAADAEARIDALRRRAGIQLDSASTAGPSTNTLEESTTVTSSAAGPSSVATAPKAPTEASGHINLFADLEAHESSLSSLASKKKPALTNDDRGVALAPSKDDLTPWYSSSKDVAEEGKSGGKGKRAGWAAREQRRKESSDPLAAIPLHIRQPNTTSRSSMSNRPSSSGDDASSARLTRESSERARAQALIARKKAERARLDGSTVATPSTVHGGYGDMYNRAEVEEARRERTWGRRGKEVNMKGRRW